MNLQLLANTNVKLPPHLAHIPLEYGYTNYSDQLNNYTLKNSLLTRKFSDLDNAINRFYPIKELDKKVINQIATTAQFIDNTLPPDFTKNLKIQINVDSHLNDKFLKMGSLLFSDSSPLIRGVSPHIACMYPGTRQIVLGTKNYENKPLTDKKSLTNLSIISYLHVKNSSLETAVEFIVLHELSHTLENYNTKKFGSLQDKIHDLYKVTQYFHTNLNNKRMYNTLGVTPEDYSISNTMVSDLDILYGEIYADCGAVLLKRNADILNHSYDKIKYHAYLDMIIDSRKTETTIDAQINKPVISNHDTVEGVSYLKEQLDADNSEKIFSLEEIHTLCQKAVTHGIGKKLEEMIEHKSSLDTLLNMRLEDNKIKLAQAYTEKNKLRI